TVEVTWSDTSFTTHRCGAWVRAAPVANPIPGLPPIEAADFKHMVEFAAPLAVGSAVVGSSMGSSLLPALMMGGMSGS
ncbi:MAG: hypothetical protein FWE39_09075, partial [Nocardiaceae bacterium]|nr:hypothetical protein [Nocardiaceae bacterium]